MQTTEKQTEEKSMLSNPYYKLLTDILSRTECDDDECHGETCGCKAPEKRVNQVVPSYTSNSDAEHGAVLFVDLPGCKKEDISVEFEKNTLELNARRHIGGSGKEYHLGLRINAAYDCNGAVAKYVDGVLEVSIPRKAEMKPTKLTIG